MKIAVLGTGMVGKANAARLAKLGYDVAKRVTGGKILLTLGI